jgi:hypothetical protein
VGERERKLPQGHREQKACATCRFALHLPDGWYCNRSDDRVFYPEWLDHGEPYYNAQFEAATAWELSHYVRAWDVCDQHEVAAGPSAGGGRT